MISMNENRGLRAGKKMERKESQRRGISTEEVDPGRIDPPGRFSPAAARRPREGWMPKERYKGIEPSQGRGDAASLR
jgi:hypothetical protein